MRWVQRSEVASMLSGSIETGRSNSYGAVVRKQVENSFSRVTSIWRDPSEIEQNHERASVSLQKPRGYDEARVWERFTRNSESLSSLR